MCDSIRKKVYEEFASEANKSNVQWYVLHGIEGYPEKIGRDLDIFVKSKADFIKLIKIFENILIKHHFRWIIRPNPIWGERVFGIDSNYNSVELHLINQVRSGIFDFSAFPISGKEYYAGIFPYNPYLMFCKGCIMPLLVKDASAYFKCDQIEFNLQNLPSVFLPLLPILKNEHEINYLTLARIAIRYVIIYPRRTLKSLMRWVKIKILRYFSPSGPIILVKDENIVEIRDQLKNKLSKVFVDITLGDRMSFLNIRKTTSLQKAVLLSRRKKFIKTNIEVNFSKFKSSNDNIKDITDKIIDYTATLYKAKVN
jgi:hypothetical protein